MRFPRFLLWILVAGMTVGGLASPALADTICDSYSERVSAAELESLRTTLKNGFPAAHGLRLARLRFENGTDPALLGPELADSTGPDPVVEIPPGLKRFQCKLLRLEFYYMNGCCDRREDIGKVVRDCALRTSRLRRCVEQFLDARIADQETGNPHRADQLRPMVEAAFRYALGHEVAHLVVNAPAGGGVASGLDEETAADMLSQFALLPESLTPVSSIATLAMLSVADRSVDWAREAHPPSACRALVADRVVLTVGPELGQAYGWLVDPTGHSARRAVPRRAESLKVFIPGDTGRCPDPKLSALAAVRQDYDRILAALDFLSAEPSRPAPAEAVLRRLMALRLATQEGERLRSDLASLSILRSEELDLDHGPEAQRRSAARLERLLASFKARAMTSEAYGRLLVNRAITRYFQHARGSDLRAMNSGLRRELEAAERYFGQSGYAKMYLGRIAFIEGRCADGRAAFEALLSLNPGFADDLRPFLTARTPADCAAAAQRLEQATKLQLGWAR